MLPAFLLPGENTMQQLTFNDGVNLTTDLLKVQHPVLCHGQPGIGKTQGWAQEVADTLNAELRVFTPSHHDPVAINGLPVPNVCNGTTDTLVNGFFADLTADKNPSKTVVLLDEIGQLTPTQQAPLMRLVLERKVADKELHNNVYLIAATNRLQDGAMTQRMATPLRNRFAHFELVPDLDQWSKAVATKYVQGRILTGFLKWKPNLFNTFDNACKDPSVFSFATPRTWEGLLKVWGESTTPNTLRMHTTALVGETPAIELETFIRVYSNIPNLDAIADGVKVKSHKPLDWNDTALQYALAVAVSGFVDRTVKATDLNGTDKLKRINNVLVFVFEHLPKDVQVFTAKTMFDSLRAQGTQEIIEDILKLEPLESLIDHIMEILT